MKPKMPRLPTRMHSKYGNDYRCGTCGDSRGVIDRSPWPRYFREPAKCVNCIAGQEEPRY